MSCHSALPTLFSQISVPFPDVTHSEQCSWREQPSSASLIACRCVLDLSWVEPGKQTGQVTQTPAPYPALSSSWISIGQSCETLSVCHAGNFHLLQNGLAGVTNQPVTPAAVSDAAQQLTSRGRVSTELTFPLTVSSSLSSSWSAFPQA